MKTKVLLLSLLMMTPVQAADLLPASARAQFVVDRLDVTSFRSSIGPRRDKNKHTFKDYGLLVTSIDENSGVLEEKDKSWMFRFKILTVSKSSIVVCIEDLAENGGHYHSQLALSLIDESTTGLLKAEDKKITRTDCPEFAR